MGLIFKMMLPLLMIFLVYGYMMHGQKIMGLWDNLQQSSKGIEGVSNAITDEDVTVYQWIDEHGVKHFSSSQPAGKTVDEVKLSAKANVLQSVKIPEKRPVTSKVGQVTSLVKSPYSPGGAKAAIDEAKNLKTMLQQNSENQKNMLDQISGKSR